MHTIYLGLGSNVGEKKKYIETTIQQLKKHIKNIIVAEYYENKPMYYKAQDDFVNTVLRGETNLTPEELLLFVKNLEKEIGRIKRFRNGPREIDIDILFYDSVILKTENLHLPHPGIQERDFILKPFMEIAPDFVHPVFKKTIKQLYGANI